MFLGINTINIIVDTRPAHIHKKLLPFTLSNKKWSKFKALFKNNLFSFLQLSSNLGREIIDFKNLPQSCVSHLYGNMTHWFS